MPENHHVQTGLRSTLADLSNTDTARFDPVRFRYLLTLVKKAESQRSSVAMALQSKAVKILEKYLDDYSESRETTVSAEPGGKGFLCCSSALAELNQEISTGRQSGPSARHSLLDEQWQQQEQHYLQSIAENKQANAASCTFVMAESNRSNSSAMHQLRKSLHQGHTLKRIQQTILEGPEAPGPLNPEGLIINSLSKMQGISAGYTLRLVDYLDSLLWLNQALNNQKRKKKLGKS